MRKPKSDFRWNNRHPHSPLDLVYLAYGPREWGDRLPDRIQSTWRNTFWNYSFVPTGTPHRLEIDGETLTLSQGEMIIIQPGCTISIIRQKPTRFHVMNWLWKSPPLPELTNLLKHPWRKLRLNEGAFAQIRQLHAATRVEIQHPDTYTRLALELVHRQLDLLLARHCERPEADPMARHELALRFLGNHPEIHNPVAALARYLEVSPSTVKRIFAQAGNAQIRELSLRLRMEEAEQRLRVEGNGVKQVALSLGYKHTNDFSRAYARYFGVTPASTISRPSKSPDILS